MEIHLLYCCGNHRSVISVRAFVFDDVLDVTKRNSMSCHSLLARQILQESLWESAISARIPYWTGRFCLCWQQDCWRAIGSCAGRLNPEQPFLELRVLKSKEYALSVIGSMLLYLVMMGSAVIMPLYVQSILGYSATVSGLVTLPGSLAMAVVSPFAGRIYDRLGMKKLFVTGALCMLASNLGMAFITMQMPVWTAGAFYVVRCAAIGCLMMPFVTWGK